MDQRLTLSATDALSPPLLTQGEVDAIFSGENLTALQSGLACHTYEKGEVQLSATCKESTKSLDEGVQRPSKKLTWRPVAMRYPYMIVIIFMSLGLSAAQEVIYQISSKRGGLLKFEDVEELSTAQWFLWRYLPPLVIILYGIGVATLDHAVMSVAQFYKLAQASGLKGDESILRYPPRFVKNILLPWRSGPLVWTSAVMALLATVVAPTVLEAAIDSHQETQKDGLRTVKIHPVWSRLLTVGFVLIATCVIALLWLLRQPSGLSQSPAGIAGLISLVLEDNVLEKLQGLPGNANEDDIDRLCGHQVYALRQGFIRQISDHPVKENVPLSQEELEHSTPSLTPLVVWSRGYAFTFAIIGIILVVVFTVGLYLTEFTGAPVWLLTGAAAVYKMLFTQFEVKIRTNEPYWHLWIGNAPASNLFADYTVTPIVFLPFKALRNGHFGLAIVALNSILAEILVVCVASLSDVSGRDLIKLILKANNGEITAAYWATSAFVWFVPLSMGLTMICVWQVRRRARLPQRPGSIVSLLVLCHSSELLNEFRALRHLSPNEKQDRFGAGDTKYALGYFQRGDHRIVAIDKEPRAAPYLRSRRHITSEQRRAWNER